MNEFEGRVFHFVYNYWDYSGATQQSIKLAKQCDGKVFFINSQKSNSFFYSTVDDGKKVIDVPSLLPLRLLTLLYIFIVKVNKSDVCHFHGFHNIPLFIACLLSRTCFLKCTLEGVDDLESLKTRNPMFLKYILKKVKFINSLNKKILEINKKSLMCNEDKLIVIPNGVEIQDVDDNLSYQRDCFICVGAVIPRKNVKEVIEYYVENYLSSELPLYIIGPADPSMAEFCDTYYKECLLLVEKYNKKVFIVGSKNKQQLYDYYRRAIAMLFFSHKEGTPNVVLEAISFNCPIIYRNEDEVVGWILSGGGIKGLTYDVVPSLQYLNQISKSGDLRERALDFDIKVIAMKTKKMYSDMVGEEL